MEYRKLPHGEEQLSVLGLGQAPSAQPEKRKSRPPCTWRCPLHVPQSHQMEEIQNYFGA